MLHPIRYLRRIRTPLCSTCRHYARPIIGEYGKCYSRKYLDHVERVSGLIYRSADNTLVRGTRFCTYEKKEDADADGKAPIPS